MPSKIKITLSAIILALTMLLATPALAQELTDIQGHWAESEIIQMVETGAVESYPDGKFYPDQSITRRQLAQAVFKLFPAAMHIDINQVATYPDYPDVHSGQGQQYLKIAALLLPGYTDGYFKPDEPASRQDVATLALSAALIQAGKYKMEQNMLLLQFTIADQSSWRKLVLYNEFSYLHEKYKKATAYWQDDPDKNNFYEFVGYFYSHLNPVALLVGHDIIKGFEDSTLGLNKEVSRAETVVILSRIQNTNNLTNSDKYILEPAGMVRLPQIATADDQKVQAGLHNLGLYYQQKYNDPLQRAKMLYNLVLHTFGYDWETRQGLKDYTYTDLPNLISTGLGTDAGLTSYYVAIAQEAGLEAAVIKGQGINDGETGEHQWVEIKLPQQVVSVDPTYGVCTGAVFFNNFDQWRQQGYGWQKDQ